MSLRIEVRTGTMKNPIKEWMINTLKRRLNGIKHLLIEAGLLDDRVLILNCIKREDLPKGYKIGEIIPIGFNGGILQLRFQVSGQETIYLFHCYSDMPGSTGKNLMDIFSKALSKEKQLIREEVIKGFLMGELDGRPNSSNIKNINGNTTTEKLLPDEKDNGSPPTLLEKKVEEPTKQQVLIKPPEGQPQTSSDVAREDLKGFTKNTKEVEEFLVKLSQRAKFGIVSDEVAREELSKLAKKVTKKTTGQVLRILVKYGKLFKCKEGYTTDASKAESQPPNHKIGSQDLVVARKNRVVEPEVLPKKDSSGLAKVLETTSLLDFMNLLKTLSEAYLQGVKEIESYEQTINSEGEEIARLEATLSERRAVFDEKKRKLEELRIVVSPESKHFKAHQQIEALRRLIVA